MLAVSIKNLHDCKKHTEEIVEESPDANDFKVGINIVIFVRCWTLHYVPWCLDVVILCCPTLPRSFSPESEVEKTSDKYETVD